MPGRHSCSWVLMHVNADLLRSTMSLLGIVRNFLRPAAAGGQDGARIAQPASRHFAETSFECALILTLCKCLRCDHFHFRLPSLVINKM